MHRCKRQKCSKTVFRLLLLCPSILDIKSVTTSIVEIISKPVPLQALCEAATVENEIKETKEGQQYCYFFDKYITCQAQWITISNAKKNSGKTILNILIGLADGNKTKQGFIDTQSRERHGINEKKGENASVCVNKALFCLNASAA